MRISVGNDIVHVQRVAGLVKNGLSRIVRPDEITRNDELHIAGRVALKEAAVKALGLTASDWLKIVIKQKVGGKPYLDLLIEIEGLESTDCSISHDGDYAIATVVALFR